MPLILEDLNPDARAAMGEEIEADVRAGTLYLSPRLTQRGVRDYPELLRTAAAAADDDWLARQLADAGRIASSEPGHTRTGRLIRRRVPRSAAITLAEGEFNRFYLRGLCLVALREGEAELEIYRAKLVRASRPESRRLEGRLIAAEPLLADLRTHPGVDTALGLPPGPNSGLSARRLRDLRRGPA